jgi:hypothetical protein
VQYPYRSSQNTKQAQVLKEPGTYKEALANVRIAIFRELIPKIS